MTGQLLKTLTAAALMLLLPATVLAADGQERVERRIEVRPGDNLGRLAARHGVSLDELRRWNADRIGPQDRIRAGDHLVVRVPAAAETPEEEWVGYYDIKRGDTLGTIARKLKVSVSDLQRWNGLNDRSMIRAGATLRYIQPGKRPTARSVGRPTGGRLEHGTHLGEGTGYRLRFPRNAYTTPSVARTLKRCTARMKKRFAGTADILIGDISRPTGGRFPPHVSHQSGRDVDIGYYIDGNVQNKTMYRLKAHEVDYEKTWELMLCLLAEDEVVRVFMDASMQRKMVDYLQRTKRLDDARIDRLFETFGEIDDKALIRHAPKHDTHIHVRFACEDAERDCAEDPGERPFRL